MLTQSFANLRSGWSRRYADEIFVVALNHQHLRAFHGVATDGSFSRAARRLNISQPTLSQQIKALEQRHGTPLFEGRRRPLLLTPMGSELLALTQRMFATAEEIDNLLGKNPSVDKITLRLAADSPIYAARLVQAMLQSEPCLDVPNLHIPNLNIIVQIENSQQTQNRLL